MTRHRASEFVRHGVITLNPDRPLWSAIKAMVLHRVPGIVLLSERDPVRVVEEADVVRALRSLEGDALRAEAWRFSRPGAVIAPGDSLLDAAVEIVRRGVTYALVRSPGSRRGVYGTLFAIDIARALTGNYRGHHVPPGLDPSEGRPRVERPPRGPERLSVGDVRWRRPLALDASSSIARVARAVGERRRRYAVLVEDGRPVGRVGDREVLAALLDAIAHRRGLKRFRAIDYARSVVTVSPNTPLHEALWRMAREFSDRAYVVRQGGLTGVVPVADAVYVLATVEGEGGGPGQR
ncbi:MAG: CBS domain-containing protein [Euryarchaeota archaeon]